MVDIENGRTRALASAHLSRLKVWPDIGASLAASRADELILDVGNADVIGPLARVHLDRVAALIVGAIDQDAISVSEGYFLAVEFDHGP
jgi:hypothetical protein